MTGFRTDPLCRALSLLGLRARPVVTSVLLGVAGALSALGLAALAAWLITRAWQMPPVLDLSVAVVAVRALGISRGILGYCERLASHDTALRAADTARVNVYRRLSTGPVEAVLRRQSGDLVARLGADVDEMADVLVRAVLPMAVAVVLSLAATVAVTVISPVAGAVLAACLLIAGVAAPWLSARATVASETVAAEEHSQRDTAVMLALEYAPELRVAGRLQAVIGEAAHRQRQWAAAVDRAAAPAAIATAVPTAAVGASVLGAVVAGIGLASVVAPTTVAILMLLPLSAFEATTALPAAAVQLARSRVAARRVLALADAPDLPPRRPPVPPVPVAPGARLAVIGPSGCGKTTLLMAMAENPSQVGFFAEDAHLFATTVRDNLLVTRGDATDDEVRDALRRVGLGPWLDALPDGLSTVLSGGAAAVSAGQRRRLLLARALISRVPTVLLDEPTEHLDAADSARLLTELLTPGALFPAERAVVVATHQLPEQIGCPTLNLGGGE